MKPTLFIFFTLYANILLACSCMTPSVDISVSNSDFIAKAKIIKITEDPNDKAKHDIEIQILDLYKGNYIKKLKIDSNQKTSCSFFTAPNTTWLIFAAKNKNGDLVFGSCSGSVQTDKKDIHKNQNNSIIRKITFLDFIKKKKLDFSNNKNFSYSIQNAGLKRLNGKNETEFSFGLYEVNFYENNSISYIETIKSFTNKETNEQIINSLKENLKMEIKNENIKQKKIIVSIFYYPKEKNNQSFFSLYAL